MNMRTKLVTTVVVCLLAVGVASTAQAQRFELTPFGGWRFGGGFESLATGADLDLDGTFSYGLIFSIPWKAEHRSRLEFVWSAQNTTLASPIYGEPAFDLDVHYLHLSGMVPFHTSIAKLDTLLTAGAGVTYLQPGIDGAGSEVGFSVSFGGGLIYHVSNRVGLRFEARGWFTFTEGGAAVFCSGGCVVAFGGSGFGQVDVTAGLQLAF
jgi:hypothetical protein